MVGAPALCNAEMKRSLFNAFTRFGAILDVVVMRTLKMRGQVRV